MNLRQQAAADLRGILEDSTDGFGWPATLMDPEGKMAAVTGTYRDIHQALDVETGQFVTGRQASLVVPQKAIDEAGFGRPKGIADGAKVPWLVALTDLQGIGRTFKVAESRPDELGCIVLILEAYERADS